MIDQKRMALVVDDEPDDLELVRHVLARAGYNVITAMDGKTAIESFRAHAEEIDILVTDVAMSPMTGCDLAAQLVQLKWNLRVVFVSAYSGAQVFRGEGATVVDGQRIEWAQGDIFVIPPWSWHSHENKLDSDTMLFSMNDWPALKALGLYREEVRD